MLLKQISLKNFRNFEDQTFRFNPFLTLIVGQNACGKTNLLEGIYFLVNSFGFRETKEEELINFKKTSALVEGKFNFKENNFSFTIRLSKTGSETKKIFLINKVKKNYYQYLREGAKTVLFSPQQLEIVTAAPEVRRHYLNRIVGSFDFEYKKKLTNYENALRKRNKILESHKNTETLKIELDFWNQYLVEQADYISQKRQEYLDFLNNHSNMDSKKFKAVYLKNEISKKRLEEFFEKERRWRRTLIGPQRDDFQIFLLNQIEKNLHFYGSRSEQRLAIFWCKVNEINFYEENFQKKPIILLDDVFSELDLSNKKLIINLIKKYQTVVTTTDIELLHLIDIPKSIIKL